MVGDYLFSDIDFLNNLSAEQPNIFKRIFEEIKYLLNVATAGSREAKELETVKRVFEKAYNNTYLQVQFGKEKINTSGAVRYSLVGVDENGIEVYETSDDVKRISYAERNKMLLKSVLEEYKGRTAKFYKNGEAYYALYNDVSLKKGVYGDKKSDSRGRKAKTNIGADGNYIELAENALYTGSSAEQGKITNNKFHTDAKMWDYYEKTIKCDGKYFDVLINVKDTGNGQYVYDITLKETSLPHRTNPYSRDKPVSNDRISQTEENATKNLKFSLEFSLEDDIGPVRSDIYGKDITLDAPVREVVISKQANAVTYWINTEIWRAKSGNK